MGRFKNAIIGKDTISIIAEIKRYSPSYGKPFPVKSVGDLVSAYEKGNASALSVVTEPSIFKGHLELLEESRKLTQLPLLRKDFITKADQLTESRDAGADAVLLIAKLVPGQLLKELVTYAQKLGLDAVVEIHTEEELAAVLELGLPEIIIGVNNRNLRNFSADVRHGTQIIKKIPNNTTVIAESAFKKPEDFALYQGFIDAVLIGTAFLISDNPLQTLTSFTTYARRSS